MGAAKKLIDKKTLRDLIPINALSPVHIEEISKKAVIEQVRSGRYVFKQGDRDNQSVYLLEGKVELVGDGRTVVGTVTAGSDSARHPLAHKQPRQISVRAVGAVTVARVDSGLLDVLLTWDQSSGYDVVELGGAHDEDDWMTRMLQSEAFLQLPPSNIQQLLMRMETVGARAGEVIVRQGDEGDYFYVVKSGRLAVTRKASARGREVLLAELSDGACFGEEALVSDTRRNATVTMVTDGSLMRLSKQDFNELLRTPLVHEISYAEAKQAVEQGAEWLDVRLPGEFDNQAIRGSRNLPLSALRDEASKLDAGRTYIVCCDTGRRSASGAFVLSQRGFDVYVLANGLGEVPAEDLTDPGKGGADTASQEAEVIPFESESAADSGQDQETAAADAALREQIDALKSARDKAQQQLAALGTEHRTLQTKFEELGREHAKLRIALQQATEQGDRETDALREARRRISELEQQLKDQSSDHQQLSRKLETRLAQLEKEGDQRLQAQQSEIERLREIEKSLREQQDASVEQLRTEKQHLQEELHAQQQRALQQSKELERELSTVRDDYQQLGQRASALAGERDALRVDLEKLQQQMEALRADQDAAHSEQDRRIGELRAQLEERERELEEHARQREDLESRLAQQAERIAILESAERDAHEQQEALAGELEAARLALDESQASNEALAEEKRTLTAELGALRDELQAAHAGHKTVVGELEQRLRDAESERDAARDKLLDTENRLTEAAAQQADSAAQLKVLEERLTSERRELESELDTARQALARAQREQENTLREQSRLMEALRQAEHRLEQQQFEHDNELHRLRKELEEAGGEADAALAAEIEVLETRLKEVRQQAAQFEAELTKLQSDKEDAESAAEMRVAGLEQQLEDLERQLAQAQDSARQAEQQLLEANEAANEEMAVRLQAEEDAQLQLRAEIERLTGEGNAKQEQLTLLEQKVAELEQVLQEVQSAAAESTDVDELRQRLQAREEALDELQAQLQQACEERDAAAETARQARHEADRLRAEAEVTRGLVDMQGDAAQADPALREELEQVRKDIEVAVRLRTRAEQRADELQAEVERLRNQLSGAAGGGGAQHADTTAFGDSSLRVPSLDDSDPDAAVAMTPVADDSHGEGEFEEEEPDTAVRPGAPRLIEESGPATGRRGLFVGLVLLAAGGLAAGGWWFMQGEDGAPRQQPGPASVAAGTVQPSSQSGDASAKPVTAPRSSEPGPAVTGSGVTKEEAQTRTMPRVVAAPAPAEPPPVPPSKPQRAPIPEPEPVPPAPETVDTTPAGVEQTPRAPETPKVPVPVRTFRDPLSGGGRGPRMVELAADSFEMGSGSTSPRFEERPRHTVHLRRFAIGAYEVTFEDYDRFARATGRALPDDQGWGRGRRPVVNVNWEDAVAYTRWLSQQTGRSYRLPTEAEWEYAARAGSQTRFWWGGEADGLRANCFDCGSEWDGARTAPVGSFRANALGLHDTAGNVMEWVQDCYVDSYRAAPDDGSAMLAGPCSTRVVRGGGYSSPSEQLRSASRADRDPASRLDNLGFRVARDL